VSHRSSRRGALSALLPVLALFALAAPAGAAAPDNRAVTVPADAPAVATTSSGAMVLAWVHGGSTCTALQRPGTPRPTRAASFTGLPGEEDVAPGGCDATPVLARFGGAALGAFRPDDPASARSLVWGVAGEDTGSVLFKAGAPSPGRSPPRRPR